VASALALSFVDTDASSTPPTCVLAQGIPHNPKR
jgi:hypothetical protein